MIVQMKVGKRAGELVEVDSATGQSLINLDRAVLVESDAPLSSIKSIVPATSMPDPMDPKRGSWKKEPEETTRARRRVSKRKNGSIEIREGAEPLKKSNEPNCKN